MSSYRVTLDVAFSVKWILLPPNTPCDKGKKQYICFEIRYLSGVLQVVYPRLAYV